MENDIINSIANVGFPVVISVYLLVRIENKLEKLSNSITELNKSISLLAQEKTM